MGGRGPRKMETMCTVCKTIVGAKKFPDDTFRVARHSVPGSVQTTANKRRLTICGGGGIAVPEAAVMPGPRVFAH